ncbi:yajR [Wigglesworthia glossinidia endosymbiont of Glossina brevipalpis]|uniref:YajR protein n=1 Tax=Wigglesworthia glossinidia brevipalpis TaxID=36870 RepID=Q8D344_WIGBR|nr:yajR [Wigglesworthia glossinidia endosymbiont of Glossina brevipalpis]
MNNLEKKFLYVLSIIFSFRMFGVFMILPVLSNYGMSFNGANSFLIGISIGIYGVTQSIFQIPFGLLSDKYGRKNIIIIGFLLIIIGSFICGIFNNIWIIILGRAIQGMGAISSVIMALITDLTSEKNRIKSMAFIGSSFGITFALSIIFGPILAINFGIKSIFWITLFLSILSIFLILFIIPSSNKTNNKNIKTFKNAFTSIFNNKFIMYINLSIFFLHSILISNFIVFPFLISNAGCSLKNHWKVYFLSILISLLILSILFSFFKFNYSKNINKKLYFFISMLLISEIFLLFNSKNIYISYIGIQMFFLGFSALEVILPACISKIAPLKYKGTAMGIYSTSQFFGVAFGGLIGGLLFYNKNDFLVFLFLILIILIWIYITFSYKNNF